MESQRFCHLFFMMTWIFVFFLHSVCSGMDTPKLNLSKKVFVAIAGEDLTVDCNVEKPANMSADMMTCFDPLKKQIYNCDIPPTTDQAKTFPVNLELKNLTRTGEYHCKYKNAMLYFFVRVRDDGYKEPIILDYTEFIIMAFFTGVLLIFSVAGSVYVFRGDWKKEIHSGGKTGKKRKQNREERREREMPQDHADAISAPSTSFYASLEPRPRSIYDVLGHSAADREQDQGKAKPKGEEAQQTAEQTTQNQDEGVFESVYENF